LLHSAPEEVLSTRSLREAVRIAMLAIVASAVLAAGGFARVAPARGAASGQICGSVTLSDPQCAQAQPVASLQPAVTRRLWQRLVDARQAHPFRLAAAGDCHALRAVFYTATDWMRLATKLAANSSPCAQYYLSIPSLAADHTQVRADQAWRIRALGPQFHAMAEISMAAWGKWASSTGNSWYQAGVEARRRMAAAGYDVRAGDTWAVNEFSSAIRQGLSTARVDARNFVRGLYDGDGTQPPARGAVFIIGMGQGTQNLSVYKANLENWLSDTAFWDDMNRYVSDWSQELFGDYRNYGVASAALTARRDSLNDYLQHVIAHANAGPAAAASARSFLQAAYSPLANAAWQYDAAFGWTLVSAAQMEDYASAQAYALRWSSATSQPARADHWGFAWSPKNTSALPATDFDTQSGQIIDRLASAIHDSDRSDASDPGRSACGIGQNWCNSSIAAAAFNPAWKTFTYWGSAGLAFATPSQTIAAGSSSTPLSIQLQASGTAQASPGDLAVTMSSSSPTGTFSIGDGVWTHTLQLTIPAGSTTAPAVSYQDTRAGSPTLTASASGVTSGTQAETVTAAALNRITVSPASATISAGATQAFTAAGSDAYGNAIPVDSAIWSVSPAGLGTIAPASGATTVFTAGTAGGSPSVTAGVGGITGSAAITTVAAGSAPTVPTRLTATPAASRGVSLAWSAPASNGGSAITGYRVYRGARSGAETVLVALGNVNRYTDTATQRGTTYYYTLVALNAAGSSPASSEVSARAR
jgi:hypothetical protein